MNSYSDLPLHSVHIPSHQKPNKFPSQFATKACNGQSQVFPNLIRLQVLSYLCTLNQSDISDMRWHSSQYHLKLSIKIIIFKDNPLHKIISAFPLRRKALVIMTITSELAHAFILTVCR